MKPCTLKQCPLPLEVYFIEFSMKTSGPFLLADVNCLDFLPRHICIVFGVRLLHNFCSTTLSSNFTTLSIKRHHDIITGST